MFAFFVTMKISWTLIVMISSLCNLASCVKIEECEVDPRPECSPKDNSVNTPVDGKVKLKPIIDEGTPEAELINIQKIFFIESSGRDFLTTRQACAIESALNAHQGKNFFVVVILISEYLNVHGNNATHQLWNKTLEKNLLFRHCTLEEAVINTPLDKFEILQSVKSSSKKIVHTSDVLRLALVYKFGGWYSDIDTIIMRPLTDFADKLGFTENVILSSDTTPPEEEEQFNKEGNKIIGTGVANGFFKSSVAGSDYIKLTMDFFVYTFKNSNWASGGSIPMTYALKGVCGLLDQNIPYITLGGPYDPSRCPGVRVIDSKYFYVFSWTSGAILTESKYTVQGWLDLLSESFSVDFFASSLGNSQKILKPKFYGKYMPALAALAPVYCPLSFHSEKLF